MFNPFFIKLITRCLNQLRVTIYLIIIDRNQILSVVPSVRLIHLYTLVEVCNEGFVIFSAFNPSRFPAAKYLGPSTQRRTSK